MQRKGGLSDIEKKKCFWGAKMARHSSRSNTPVRTATGIVSLLTLMHDQNKREGLTSFLPQTDRARIVIVRQL